MNTHSVEVEGKIIETTVTDKGKVADEWVQSMKKQDDEGPRLIGMGCKFIQHPILCMSNKTALLQLCFQTKCLLLQLLHMDYIPHSVLDLLNDSNTTLVGIDIHHNSRKLLQEYQVRVNRTVDIHFLAKRWFPLSYKGRPSLRGLANGILGFSMKKCRKSGELQGDWESRILDTELVEQACIDAYTSYTIAHTLLTPPPPPSSSSSSSMYY